MRSPGRGVRGIVVGGLGDGWWRGRTDFCGAFHFEDFDAFCYGGSGVVDDVHHGLLGREVSIGGRVLCWRRFAAIFGVDGRRTLSWIILVKLSGRQRPQLFVEGWMNGISR